MASPTLRWYARRFMSSQPRRRAVTLRPPRFCVGLVAVCAQSAEMTHGLLSKKERSSSSGLCPLKHSTQAAFVALTAAGRSDVMQDPRGGRLAASCNDHSICLLDTLRPELGVIRRFTGHLTSSFYVKVKSSPIKRLSLDESVRTWFLAMFRKSSEHASSSPVTLQWRLAQLTASRPLYCGTRPPIITLLRRGC
jgi:hypothetical protein